MTEPEGIESLADLEWDLAGSRARAAWVACLGSQAPPDPLRNLVVREKATPRASDAVSGSSLVECRPPDTRARYRTVHWIEDQYAAAPTEVDFACLIASACQVVEAELNDLLVTPAREVAGPLVAALRARDKEKQAELLLMWGEGKFPATIGTASLVLMALRYAVEDGDAGCVGFLAANFRPGFVPLARTKTLAATLDKIRNEYRNPACHGQSTFGPAAYQTFARLAVARERFSAWAASGPQFADPAGSLGLLHHHLAGSLRLGEPTAAAPEPSPAERMLGLAEPRGSGLVIRLELVTTAGDQPAALRDLKPRRLGRPIRVGDTVQFRFRANRACEVALIDIGTSGAVSVVLPNRWAAKAAVEADRPVLFPDADTGAFDFELAGPPGVERVVALAWEGRLPVPLTPAGEHPFRELAPAEVAALCGALRALPPERWAACAVEFEAAG